MALPDNLLCLFSGRVEKQNGSYVIEIPQQELEIGELEESEIYRVALLFSKTESSEDTEPRRAQEAPPVAEGEVVDVEIEDITTIPFESASESTSSTITAQSSAGKSGSVLVFEFFGPKSHRGYSNNLRLYPLYKKCYISIRAFRPHI